MAFSPSQNGTHYRPMVDRAWRAHCDRECITESTTASKKAWYQKELLGLLGVTTTKRCNKSKDFDQAMAHFEELAGEGVYWQTKLLNGDDVRARHALGEVIKTLRITDDYLDTIRDQMGIANTMRCLTVDEAVNIKVALLRQVRRRQAAPGPFHGRVIERPAP